MKIVYSACLFLLSAVIFTLGPLFLEAKLELFAPVTRSSAIDLCEFLGLSLIALTVWLFWRRELELKGLGPFTGGDLETQAKEDYERGHAEPGDLPWPKVEDVSSLASDHKAEELKQQRAEVLRMLETKHALTKAHVSLRLKINTETAGIILYSLVRDGLVRGDGFPETLYTLAQSLENLALDRAFARLRELYQVKRERRFVKLKGTPIEFDAVVESAEGGFVIEVKFIRGGLDLSALNRWIAGLRESAKAGFDSKTKLLLVLVYSDNTNYVEIDRVLRNLSFSAESYSAEIWAFSERELRAH